MITVVAMMALILGLGEPQRVITVPIPPTGGTVAAGPLKFCTDVFSIPVPAGSAVFRPIRGQLDLYGIGPNDAASPYGIKNEVMIRGRLSAAGGPAAISPGPGASSATTIAGVPADYMLTVRRTTFIVNDKPNYAYTLSRDQGGQRYVAEVSSIALSDRDLRKTVARIVLGSRQQRGCSLTG